MINLLFHGLGAPESRSFDPGEERMWISAALFEGVARHVAGRSDVGLSFDDGNRSDVEVALPVLERHGLRAGFFVVASRIGSPGFLDATDLRALHGRGMEVGSHGMDHRGWRGLSDAELRREVVESKDRIEQALGAPVTAAACPLGSYDRRSLAALRAAGYARVYTSDRWIAEPGAWIQPRYSVRAGDSEESVRGVVDARPGWLPNLRARARLLAKRWR